ncbi:replicase [Pistacia-associated flexivirus 1]|uniref:Replicase n=1 Tax=Entoleuca gammaflexivirus 2 TaxID=2086642 RepID=A0AAD0GUT0_9VIRU|nr:replicase [Entoleuca gammaflexivirus 2]AVD68668.2 replicase [Entoleuca gammaflexivirus 2]
MENTLYAHGIVSRTNHADALVAPTLNELLAKQKITKLIAPFAIPPNLSKLLDSNGVPVDPEALATHRHPAHKTIENYFLNGPVRSAIREDCTAYFVKENSNKLALAGIPNAPLANTSLTAIDINRYPEAPTGAPPPCTTPLAFMHDALHYMTAADIAEFFRRSPHCHTLIATMVYPPEARAYAPSAYPELYELRYSDNNVTYIPEGHTAGSYTQPRLNEFIDCHTIATENHRLTVTFHETLFAHHLVIISTKDRLPQRHRQFRNPAYVTLPAFLHPFTPVQDRMFPKQVAVANLAYARSVNRLTPLQATGRIRAVVNDTKTPLSLEQIACLEHHMVAVSHLHSPILSSPEGPRGLLELVWAFATFPVHLLLRQPLAFAEFAINSRYTQLETVKQTVTPGITYLHAGHRLSAAYTGKRPAPSARAIGQLIGKLITGHHPYSSLGTNLGPNGRTTPSSLRRGGSPTRALICYAPMAILGGLAVAHNNPNLRLGLLSTHKPSMPPCPSLTTILRSAATTAAATGSRALTGDITAICTIAGAYLAYRLTSGLLAGIADTVTDVLVTKIADLPQSMAITILRFASAYAGPRVAEQLYKVNLELEGTMANDSHPFVPRETCPTDEEEVPTTDPGNEPHTRSRRSNSPHPTAPSTSSTDEDDDTDPEEDNCPTCSGPPDYCHCTEPTPTPSELFEPSPTPSRPTSPQPPPTEAEPETNAQTQQEAEPTPNAPPNNGHPPGRTDLDPANVPLPESDNEAEDPSPAATTNKSTKSHTEAERDNAPPPANRAVNRNPKNTTNTPEPPRPNTRPQKAASTWNTAIAAWSRNDENDPNRPKWVPHQTGTVNYPVPTANTCLLDAFAPHLTRAAAWLLLLRHCSPPPTTEEVNSTGLHIGHAAIIAYSHHMRLHVDNSTATGALVTHNRKTRAPSYVGYHRPTSTHTVRFELGDGTAHWSPRSTDTPNHKLKSIPLPTTAARFAKAITLPAQQLSIDKNRALSYLEAIRQNEGIANRMKGFDYERWKATVKGSHRPDCAVTGYLGLPGSAKSAKIKDIARQILAENPDKVPTFKIVARNNSLANELAKDLALPAKLNFVASTYETALMIHPGDTLILDDVGLFPAGYTDLYLALHPNIRLVVFTGDTAQGTHRPTRRPSPLDHLTSEITHLAPYAVKYIFHSTTLADQVAAQLGLPREVGKYDNRGSIKLNQSFDPTIPTIAPDTETAKAIPGAHTYESCQGLRIHKPYNLLISKKSLYFSDGDIFTALTRGTTHVHIVCPELTVADRLAATGILAALIRPHTSDDTHRGIRYTIVDHISTPTNELTRAVINHISRHAPSHLLNLSPPPTQPVHVVDPNTPIIGIAAWTRLTAPATQLPHRPPPFPARPAAPRPNRNQINQAARAQFATRTPRPLPRGGRLHSEKLPHLHHLKADIFAYPQIEDEDPAKEADQPTTTTPSPTIRETRWRDNATRLHGFLMPDSEVRAHRELWSDRVHSWSSQIDGLPYSIESIFLKHRTKDAATAQATLEKRVRRTSQRKKEMAFIASRHVGAALYNAFCEEYGPQDEEWDPQLYEECRVENETVHLSKPLPTLTANASRSDPSWPLHRIELFMKNQNVTKLGKLNADARAGQIIANFRAQVILTLGPLGRYLAKKILSKLPDHTYVHHGKTTAQLAEFVDRLWDFNQESMESDATAFDQSNGPDILHAETYFMRAKNVPQHLVDYYLDAKRLAYTFLGPLEFMRLTGEVFTLLFNTLAMMMYLAFKYIIPKNTPRAHTGDDVIMNARPKLRPSSQRLLTQIRITTVDEYTKTPSFVGWRLTPGGLIKDPRLLLARAYHAESKNKELETCVSYYYDLTVGLRNWTNILPHLPTQEVAAVHELAWYYQSLAKRYPPLAQALRNTGFSSTSLRF